MGEDKSFVALMREKSSAAQTREDDEDRRRKAQIQREFDVKYQREKARFENGGVKCHYWPRWQEEINRAAGKGRHHTSVTLMGVASDEASLPPHVVALRDVGMAFLREQGFSVSFKIEPACDLGDDVDGIPPMAVIVVSW